MTPDNAWKRTVDRLIEEDRIERQKQARRGRLVRILARWVGGALIALGVVLALVALVLWLGGWR